MLNIFKIIASFIFKWDYVYWETVNDDGAITDYGVSRIFKAKSGEVYFYRDNFPYGNMMIKLQNQYQVVWLTCPSNKYFK